MNLLTKLAIKHLRKTRQSYIINCKFHGGITIETNEDIHLYDSGFHKETYVLTSGKKRLLADLIKERFTKGADND